METDAAHLAAETSNQSPAPLRSSGPRRQILTREERSRHRRRKPFGQRPIPDGGGRVREARSSGSRPVDVARDDVCKLSSSSRLAQRAVALPNRPATDAAVELDDRAGRNQLL